VNKTMLKTLAIAFFVTLFSIASYAADEFGDSVVLPATTSVSDTITTSSVSGANIGSNENIGLYIIEWVLRGISITSPENTLFGAISGILNTLVLAFALVAIGKHGLQFVTLTTTKGTPGGNQLSGGVIAIRSSIAIAMLSPVIANGFSPVQLLVKETTMVGAYAADRAVRLSTDYLSGGSVAGDNTGSAITPATLVGISDVVWAIALNETCSAAVDAYYALDKTRGVANDSDPTPFTLRIDGDKVIYQWGWSRPYTQNKNPRSPRRSEPTACGTVAINIPSVLSGKVRLNRAGNQFFVDPNPKPSPDEAIYTAQLRAHKAALENAIYNISSTVTTPLYKDQSQLMSLTALRYSSATAQQIETIQNQISTTVQQLPTEIPKYAAALIAIDLTYAQKIRNQGSVAAKIIAKNSAKTETSSFTKLSTWMDGEKTAPKRTWQETLNAQGFAALGSYYWIQLKTNMAINAVQEHIAEKGDLPSIFKDKVGIDENKDMNTIQNLPNFKEIVNRVGRLREIYLTNRPNDQLEMNFSALRNATDVNGEQGWFKNTINATFKFLLTAMEGAFASSTNNDIIINMVNLGTTIVSTAEVAFLFIIAASMAESNPVGEFVGYITGASGVIGALAGFLTPFLVMGLLIGLVLQFVLPTIPLIKWLVALQSWAIMMFVAMVYAPIWMMSTAAASNEDWVNDKVKDGFIMLAELILRPLLMVFGFYAAKLLMAVANIGARMAFPYLIGLADEGILSLFSMASVLVIAVFISYKLTTRTFDLIYELPDFIIERMGGRPLGDAVKDDTANSTVMIAGKLTTGVGGAAAGVAKATTK